jgi:excisionase family DNA binding protein
MRDVLRISEAAEELGVTPLTVRRYIYKGLLQSQQTAGGHHRIPQSEIQRLRTGTCESDVPSPKGPNTCSRRLHRLEQDVATLQKQLAVMARSCALLAHVAEENGYTPEPRPTPKRTLEVLGPGCPACDRLAELTEAVVADLGLPDVHVKRVKKLDDIVAYGPLLTPALIVEGKLVSSGTVPSKRQLAKMVQTVLPGGSTAEPEPNSRSWFWKRK